MRKSTTAAAAAALVSTPLAAQDELRVPGEYRLYEENDLFNPFTEATDRYYTQGLRLERLKSSWNSDREFLPGVSHEDWCSLVCGGGDNAERAVNTGYALGQNMYTPANVTVAAPQPEDRPWAGLLYVSRIARASYEEPSLKAQRQDRIEVSLGVVGPASLAGDTQIWWHDTWGFGPLNGWDNQLKNEPVLQLRYDTAVRWPKESGGHADLIPRVRLNLGNALASADAEVTGRVGWNLSGFGVQTIGAAPLMPAASAIDGTGEGLGSTRILPSLALFGRVGLKAVAHNILLDGNTFVRNDIRIGRKPFVPEWAIGVEANLFWRLWATFQFVHRGSEFETSRGRNAPAQEFGSITLAYVFRG